MHQFIKRSVFALVLLSTVPVSTLTEAQQSAAPWFDVEVIVFSRDGATAGGNESWPAEPGNPQLDGAWRLAPTGGDRPNSHALLPNSEWRMKPIAYSLTKSRERLHPLLHVAWRQPVLSRRAARPVALRSAERSSGNRPLLEGTIKISVNRYLHVDLDLLLLGALKQQAENGGFIPGEFQTYRFQAHRRMRSGEIHFIDHPLMGALVLITRFESPTPAPEADIADTQTGEQEAPAETPQQTTTPETAD